MPAYRALTDVMVGTGPIIKPGEPIPDTFTDATGREHHVDFDRLIELGAVIEEKIAAQADKLAQETAHAAEQLAAKAADAHAEHEAAQQATRQPARPASKPAPPKSKS